jgi:hypothetical protein
MSGQIAKVLQACNENVAGIDKLNGLVSNFMKQLLQHIQDGGLNTSLPQYTTSTSLIKVVHESNKQQIGSIETQEAQEPQPKVCFI